MGMNERIRAAATASDAVRVMATAGNRVEANRANQTEAMRLDEVAQRRRDLAEIESGLDEREARAQRRDERLRAAGDTSVNGRIRFVARYGHQPTPNGPDAA